MSTVFREKKNAIQLSGNGNPNFPPHVHEAIELMYIKSGSGTAHCDGEAYRLQAGDFFLVFPNQIHSYDGFGPDGNCMLAIANPATLTLHTAVFREKLPLSARYRGGEGDGNLLRMLHILLEEHERGVPADVLASILSAAVAMLLEHYALTDGRTGQSCAHTILLYCKTHYKEALTVERLSRELHISRSHISHLFNERFRISLPEYINSLRLADAVRLLDEGGYSVTEVAQRAGFQTIRTFNRAFLKRFGVSPRQFRQEKTPAEADVERG